MSMNRFQRVAASSAAVVAAVVVASTPVSAGFRLFDESAAAATGRRSADAHRHDPIDVQAAPIVSRLPVPAVRPCRLLVDRHGNLYVADSAAEKVYKLTPEGTVSTLAEELVEPSGLACDAAGNIYISNYAGGEPNAGTIIRITPEGKRTTFARHLTGPGALAFDSKGSLYVASPSEDTIVIVDRQGRVVPFVNNIAAPAGLAFDERDNLYVVGQRDGVVSKITPAVRITVIARGLPGPSDICANPDGGFLVSTHAGTELIALDAQQKMRPVVRVPTETVSAVFDSDGNIVAANRDYGLVLKITVRLSIPCPHCGRKIPVRLKPKTETERTDSVI